MPKSKPVFDLVSESDLMNRFEVARTWNRFYILYLLRDGIPRSRPELLELFRQRTPYVLRQTIHGVVDTLLRDSLIFETADGLFCINRDAGEGYTVAELKILRFLVDPKEFDPDGRSISTIQYGCGLTDKEIEIALEHLVDLNRIQIIKKDLGNDKTIDAIKIVDQ